jgi:hypothetical protein
MLDHPIPAVLNEWFCRNSFNSSVIRPTAQYSSDFLLTNSCLCGNFHRNGIGISSEK